MAEPDPKTWQPVLQDAFHPPSIMRKVAKQVLSADTALHRSLEARVPTWRWPLWTEALNALAGHPQKGAKPGGWWTEKVFGDDWGREGPPRFKSVQIGPDKHRSALTEGGMVLGYAKDGGEHRMVLSVNPIHGGWLIDVTAVEDQQEDVERLFREINDWISANNFFKGARVDPFGKFLKLGDVSEDDLVLAPALKDDLFRNIVSMIEKAPAYAKYGIPAKRGVILAGPPGNGKTMSCKVLAKKLPCSFIWVTPRHIEQLDGLAHVYDFAREIAPTVVLLEDADAFGIDRRLGQFNPLLGELLQHLDGLVENKGVITVLSSNYAEVLDSALTQRPGRFDVKLKFDPPAGEEAFELLRRTLEKRNVAFQGNPETLKRAAFTLAEHRASGAHMVEAANLASMLAVERGAGGDRLAITEVDVAEATQRIVASLAFDVETEKSVANEGIYKWGAWYAAPGG